MHQEAKALWLLSCMPHIIDLSALGKNENDSDSLIYEPLLSSGIVLLQLMETNLLLSRSAVSHHMQCPPHPEDIWKYAKEIFTCHND